MITKNEERVLKFIATNPGNENYVNNIARELSLAPSGGKWILANLEKRDILEHRKVGNLKCYKIKFNDKSKDLLRFIYNPELDKRLKFRKEDLKPLMGIVDAAIVFGSYLYKKDPNDIDILFIFKNKNFKKFSKELDKIKELIPIKVHDVIQTREDLISNILIKDKIVIEALSNGKILWGEKFIVEVLKDVSKKT